MPIKPRQFRLDDDTLRKIDELAELFSSELAPASRTAVVKHAVETMHATKLPKARTRKGKTK